jgi:hypothetical protein
MSDLNAKLAAVDAELLDLTHRIDELGKQLGLQIARQLPTDAAMLAEHGRIVGREQDLLRERKRLLIARMTKEQIKAEAQELRRQFSLLKERYDQAPAGEERDAIRREMEPVVDRENKLREEYAMRLNAEIAYEPPEMGFGF